MRTCCLLVLALLLGSSGCAGVYLPPMANVPALRRAGQATASASARVFAPQHGTHAAAAVAITDSLRVAGTVSSSFAKRRGIYGEGLLGAEPRLNRLLQLGVLGGVGYGDVDADHRRCREDEGSSDSFCLSPGNHVDQARATYLRYSLQTYLTVYAPKIVHGGGGLRVSLLDMHLHEIDGLPVQRRALPVALEPFAFVRVGAPFFQAEVQLRYTGLMNDPRDQGHKVVVSDQFAFMVGIRTVFGPGIHPRWPRGWRYE
ncbi:MAG: hypothetical protein RLZZ450_4633 [Pseudomonadota bacterium]